MDMKSQSDVRMNYRVTIDTAKIYSIKVYMIDVKVLIIKNTEEGLYLLDDKS